MPSPLSMRAPVTLWRYTAVELWRLVLLTTSVLVVVIVFAAAVRYTAAGKLGPLETLRFMVLAMVPMLQYALPFAAGFGATLAYHRMAQDNELKAAAASGVSHRSLLVPALASGMLLSAILGLLTANVIPGFLRGMQRMVTEDMTKMVVGSIRSGQALEFGGRMIHADSVREMGPDAEGNFSQVLLLTGVVGVEVDPEGKVQREVTAKQALVGISRNAGIGEADGSSRTLLTLVLKEASAWSIDGEGSIEEARPMTFAMPGGMDDDPKFLTSAQLSRLPENPDRLNIIKTRCQQLAYHIAERQCTATIDAALRASKSVRMEDEGGRKFLIRAAGLKWDGATKRWELLPVTPGEPLEVEMRGQTSGEGDRTRMAAQSGAFASSLTTDSWWRTLTISLELANVITVQGSNTGGERKQRTFAKLRPTPDPLPELLKLSSRELLDKVAKDPVLAGDPFITGPARDLEKRIRKLNREIISKRHERAAISISCMIMVIAGALSAMRLASSMPLTVYLWSFFPALISVITVSAGQQVTHQAGVGGLAILWSGVGLLVAYVAVAFAMVRRH
jgi:lipopolysaccharide export system permease protein